MHSERAGPILSNRPSSRSRFHMEGSSSRESSVRIDPSAVALLANRCSIIELSTGTMCGCMPYLTSFFRRLTFKTSQLSLLKSIKSGISNLFSRGFHSTRRSSSYDRANSDSGIEHYLETRILGSVSGKGKFMGSKHSTQREWLNRTVVAKENRGATPIPEEWNRVPTRSMV